MAEEEEPKFEVEVIQSWFKRNQEKSMGIYGTAVDGYALDNVAASTPGGNAAEVLGDQAQLLGDADQELGSMKRAGKYDSQASYAAAISRGIDKKMRSMGMLDDVRSAADDVGTPMTADYIDPVTGEKVTVGAPQSRDDKQITRDAYDEVAQQANESFLEGTEYLNRGSAKHWNKKTERKEQTMLTGERRRYDHVTYEPKDAFWEDAYGENAKDMQQSYNDGKINMHELTREMSKAVKGQAMRGNATLRNTMGAERDLREANAVESAKIYNDQEAQAQSKKDALAGEAASAQQDIKRSILQDKQTLNRANDGAISDSTPKRARVDYGGADGSGRPV